jgi:kinesin family protein 4/21/27
MKKSTYTFDHVFGEDLSQSQLYAKTAAPMLSSFMEGYNCTIMVYGQTGSGKTFTMGTSDTDTSNKGLISRFITDLYATLTSSIAKGRHISFQIKAGYLEIYGQKVHDLLDPSASESNRISLAVREDESGCIFVQGQRKVTVGSAESALKELSKGAKHRITTSTAMNAKSSRSHAMFTLLLEQKIRGADSKDIQLLSSKFTFVDLAGSEDIKRTQAKMEESIQINMGLFYLRRLINDLVEKKRFILYRCSETMHVTNDAEKISLLSSSCHCRNSKLTMLLKDALGGNSQTLFLACVSHADSDESETRSTLEV